MPLRSTEATCVCVYVTYEEEDTCMSYEEEDTCPLGLEATCVRVYVYSYAYVYGHVNMLSYMMCMCDLHARGNMHVLRV